MTILCSRIGCPLEVRAKAICDTIEEGEKRGAKFNAYMEFAESCGMCARTRRWERLVDGSARATREDSSPSTPA